MALIVDFLLIAASGAACFYCWTLNGRLKALTNTKDGIHSGIAALSQSAEDMQHAMDATREQAETNAVKLEAMIAAADAKMGELDELAAQIKAISKNAVDETETATKNLVDILGPHIKQARASAHLLLDALAKAPVAQGDEEKTRPDPRQADADADPTGEEIEVGLVVENEAVTATGEAA